MELVGWNFKSRSLKIFGSSAGIRQDNKAEKDKRIQRKNKKGALRIKRGRKRRK